MSYVLDSNILLRMAQVTHSMHAEATQATTALLRQGETVHITPQNLYEFWSVATREIQFNGLGLSVVDAQAELARLKRLFLFLPDSPAIYPEWDKTTSNASPESLSFYRRRCDHKEKMMLTKNGK